MMWTGRQNADCTSVLTRGMSKTATQPVFLFAKMSPRGMLTVPYKVAVHMECERLASERTGGIVQAFNEAISTKR